MIRDKKVFKHQDLLLKISRNIDPEEFDINKYEVFLDGLCGQRISERDYKSYFAVSSGRPI